MVKVKLWPYKQNSLAQRLNHKLCRRYYGPFSITKRIGPIAYQLELPTNSQIYHVFHVSQLKPFYGSPLSLEILDFPSNGQDPLAYNYPLVMLNNRKVIVDG